MFRFRKCRKSHHLVHILIFFPYVGEGDTPSLTHPLHTLNLPSGTPLASHEMFCCITMCIFLTNILQNRRKRISAKLLDDGTRHGHTLSQPAHNVGNHRPAGEMPFKCFRCCVAKKEGGGEGWGVGGGGWRPTRKPR